MCIGALLFNLFSYYLFMIMNYIDFPSYADCNTSCTRGNLIKKIIQELETNKKSPPSGLVILN